jgi:transposase
MRKQYDGLYALVVAELKVDPLSGDLFLFTNRRHTRAQVRLWDGTGLCPYQKRPERGRFASFWHRGEQEAFEMTLGELALFLEGSTFAGALRLSPPTTSAAGRGKRAASDLRPGLSKRCGLEVIGVPVFAEC